MQEHRRSGRTVVTVLTIVVGLTMAGAMPVAHAANSAKTLVDLDANTYGEWEREVVAIGALDTC